MSNIDSMKQDIKWIKEGISSLKDEWSHFQETLEKIKDTLDDHEKTMVQYQNDIQCLQNSKRRNEKFWYSIMSGLTVGTFLYILTLLL